MAVRIDQQPRGALHRRVRLPIQPHEAQHGLCLGLCKANGPQRGAVRLVSLDPVRRISLRRQADGKVNAATGAGRQRQLSGQRAARTRDEAQRAAERPGGNFIVHGRDGAAIETLRVRLPFHAVRTGGHVDQHSFIRFRLPGAALKAHGVLPYALTPNEQRVEGRVGAHLAHVRHGHGERADQPHPQWRLGSVFQLHAKKPRAVLGRQAFGGGQFYRAAFQYARHAAGAHEHIGTTPQAHAPVQVAALHE